MLFVDFNKKKVSVIFILEILETYIRYFCNESVQYQEKG